MNKQLKKWGSITLISLVIVIILVSKLFFIEGDNRSPGSFSNYPNAGYYEFNPETILNILDNEKIKVFTPYFGDPDRDEPYYASIAWAQLDYLNIANALSQETWSEPLDFDSWGVIYISLRRGCEDNPQGFYSFSVVYSKALGITNWERRYATRLIEIYPLQGLARWGGDAVFFAPILPGWGSLKLNNFKITADDALQIAEQNGGQEVRLKVNNNCRIALRVNHIDALKQINWNVDYDRAYFYLEINPYTGKHKILSTGQ